MKKRVLALLLTLCMLVSLAPAAWAEDSEELLLDEEPLELIDFADEEPTEEPAEEPAEEPTEEPADEPAEEPEEKPAEDPDALPRADEIEAGSGVCGDNLTWTLDDAGTLTISGTGPMYDFQWGEAPWFPICRSVLKVVIGSNVTSIGNSAFLECGNLESITIGSGVTSIGDYAFCGASGLTSVTIGSSVTSIGPLAFWGCSGLTTVTIPNSVTNIGVIAFGGCSNLTSISVASGNSVYKSIEGVLLSKDGTLLLICPGGKKGSYSIPNSVTEIGSAAFEDCSGLTSVTIPNCVTSIKGQAFAGCSGLTAVTIPSSVNKIGRYVFEGCSNLTSISVASGNQTYKSSNGVLLTKDGTQLITCPAGKSGSYTIPSSVTSIGIGAFEDCSGLTSVTIPNSVTNIGVLAFSNCTSLTNVTIPSSVTSIGDEAFFGCSSLTSISVASGNQTYKSSNGVLFSKDGKNLYVFPGGKEGDYAIPDGVTSIGDNAFEGCDGLTGVTIPSSVTSIGNMAFSSCSNLTSIRFKGSAPEIGQDSFFSVVAIAFYPEDDASWTEDVRQDYGGFITWVAYTSTSDPDIIASGACGDDLTWKLNYKGTLTISGTGEMWGYDSSLEQPWATYSNCIFSVIIEEGATLIGGNAFSFLYYLQSATIPDSVTFIGEDAFSQCWSLAQITIPDSVSWIEHGAFFHCTDLKSITIHASVEEIGSAAFGCCSALTSIVVDDSSLYYKSADGVLFNRDGTCLHTYPAGKTATSYTIPNTVESIGDSAFWGCDNLTSVTIPDGVTSIGDSAFTSCDSLTSVTIPDSVKSIGWNTFSNCSSLTNVKVGTGVTFVDYWAFSQCTNLQKIVFTGSAPEFEWSCFNYVTATVYYPADDPSWTEDVFQDYGGTITWVPYQPFRAPVLTEAFNSATGVRVSWKPVDGAVKYELLRKNLTANEQQWHKVGETTECSLIDKTVKSASRYTFTVRAIDAEGNQSDIDETGRTCTYIAKADITDITVMADGVHLTWSKPAGAKNFRVMRRPDGVAKWTVLDVIQGTSYVDTTAKTGTKYWYTVRGVSMDNKVLINSYNGTGWSMKPLAAPVLTEAFNSATGVRVSWNAVDGAKTYRLLRKNLTKNETEWSTVTDTTELTFIDTSAVSASRYSYTVVCIDGNGRICSPEGNVRTCTYIAMAKITSIGSVSNGVKLVWSKPAGAKNFRVFRKVDGETKWTAITDVQGTSYLDTTAEKGVKYWYTVRAITMDGTMYTNSYNSYGWSVTRK